MIAKEIAIMREKEIETVIEIESVGIPGADHVPQKITDLHAIVMAIAG